MEINKDLKQEQIILPPLWKIIAVLIQLILVTGITSILVESDYYLIGGLVLFLTGLVLHFEVRNINKEHFLFKASNLTVLYMLIIGVFIGTLNIMDYLMEEYGIFFPLKLIEIPALLLSLYFYFKYKNNYILLTSFLIFNFIIFISLNLILENTTDQYNIAENSPLALVYLNIIILLCLKYSNKLISPAKKTYNALILIYNLIGTFFYLDIYHEEMHLYFVTWMIISNLVLLPINMKYDKKYFNKMLIPISIIWLLMPFIMAIFN